jgi:hypothetical protein
MTIVGFGAAQPRGGPPATFVRDEDGNRARVPRVLDLDDESTGPAIEQRDLARDGGARS